MFGKGDRHKSPLTIVLVAALDEEEGIGLTLAELKQHLSDSHFLVIDGNSHDKTTKVAKSLGADVICQKGKGKGDAIAFGIRHIVDDFDYVVMIDADYTYPAECIPAMVEILEKNAQVGMVCGNRFNSHLHLGSIHNTFIFGNRLIAFIHNLMNGVSLRDPLTGLRVIRWKILKNWQPKSTGFDVEVEMNHQVERQGYTVKEFDIPYRERVGKKKLRMRDGVSIIMRILSEVMY